jgi:D-alanyl-D-alanine carboxypeptidase
MNFIKAYIKILLLIAVPYITNACDCDSAKSSITEAIDNFAKDHKIQAVYAIADNDNIVAQGAQGFFDFDSNQRLNISQQMPIASGTKPMTAAAILILQDKGKLNVKDTIDKHFPPHSDLWKNEKMPEWAHKINIHHLLTHSSGIQDYIFSYMIDIKKTQTEINKDIINLMAKRPLEFKPGSRAAYSNTGYVLLGMIIEKVSGKKLGEFFKTELFAPNGMKDTKLADFNDAIKFQQGKSALYPTRYYVVPNGTINPKFVPVDGKIIVAPNADGGVVSTVSDLIKWNAALHHGKILSDKSYKQMITAHFKTLPSGGYPTHMGYGMYISKIKNGHNFYHHEGRALGIRSDNGYIPSKKISLAIIGNAMVHVDKTAVGEIDLTQSQNQLDILYLRNAILDTL